MIDTEIRKNVMKYKTKFIGPLSMREAFCGAAGVALGVTGYMTFLSSLDSSLRTGLAVLLIVPFFLVGFMKIYDEPFEKMALIIITDNFLCPVKRLYETKFADEASAVSGKKGKKKEIKSSRKYKGVK